MSPFEGTGTLLRIVLRRDRRSAIVWIVAVALLAMSTAARYIKLFPSAATRRAFVASIASNRALTAMGGHIPTPTIGGLVSFKIASTLFNMVALMAMFGVVRNTRAEEESGRGELVATAHVGRSAPLAAALLATLVTTSAAACAVTLSLVGMHLDAAGSIVFGLQTLSAGLVFGAIAAVAAQASSTSRGANGLAGIALGASFVLRLCADAADIDWLRWMSPEGWANEMQAYGANRTALVVLPLAVAVALVSLAFALLARRDYGSGILPARPGAAIGANLQSPLALAWRLHRNAVLLWCLAFVVTSIGFGSLAGGMPRMLQSAGPESLVMLRRLGMGTPATFVDGFLWLMCLLLGYAIALFATLTVLRLRQEEASGNAELLLSTTVTRLGWIASHVTIALVAPVAILGLSGLVMGTMRGASVHDLATEIPHVAGASVMQSAAVCTLAGVATFAFGWFPRQCVAIGWAAFFYVNVFGQVLGPTMGVEFERAGRLVPFSHLPNVLLGHASIVGPIAGLVFVTSALVAAGLVGFRRRDVG